jgi:hypothetical protein
MGKHILSVFSFVTAIASGPHFSQARQNSV